MKKNKTNILIYIPFLISIAAFTLYFRYLFILKNNSKISVNSVITLTLYRYRNIAIFSLAVGIFLLLIKTIKNYISINKEYNMIEDSNENSLSKISVNNLNRKTDDIYINEITDSKIVNDLLENKSLKLNFINNEELNRKVKFNKYDSSKKVIEFYDLKEIKIKNNAEKKVRRKNHTKIVLNMILILLSIIMILLISLEVRKRNEINRKNLNIEKAVKLSK